jgi:telomere length regulation protein
MELQLLSHVLIYIVDTIIKEILNTVLGSDEDRTNFRSILDSLPSYDQRTVLDGTLRALSKQYLTTSSATDTTEWWKDDSSSISAAAAYLKFIISDDETRKSQLVTWLTSSLGAGVGESIGIRRAAVATFSDSKSDLETILEKSLQQFGDQLYIRHSPSIQQEGRVLPLLPYHLSMLIFSFSPLSSTSSRCRICSSNRPIQTLNYHEIF